MRVFITGASSGIGRALAHYYSRQGAVLGLVARREEVLKELLHALPSGKEHCIYAVDVTNREALHAACTDFLSKGPVDIVIANAGVSHGTLTQYKEDFDPFVEIFNTNLFALVSTFEPFIASMTEKGKGKLVAISSVAGIRGLPGAGAYCASKSAVTTYCESLRVELKPTGVNVITIAPGYIKTPLTANNPYKMPFLMDPSDFAEKAGQVIKNGSSYKIIPWQMGLVAKILKVLPRWMFDKATAGSKRKPRKQFL